MPFFPPGGSANPIVQFPYDVTEFGAIGNGVADDTAAIQACIDDAFAHATYQGYYSIILPIGTYKTTSSLVIPGGMHLAGQGKGAVIIGSFNDFLIRDIAEGDTGYSPASDIIENVTLINNGHGGGIQWSAGKASCVVENCIISTDGPGITHQTLVFSGVFMPTIKSCKFIATPYGRSHGAPAIALDATGYSDIGNDIQQWAFGRVLSGQGHSVTGGRSESCDVAFLLGQDPAGDLVSLQGFSIQAHWMEANNKTIRVRSGNNGHIKGMLGNQWGEVQPPDQAPVYGIQLEAGSYITIEDVSVGGEFSDTAIRVTSGMSNVRFVNCSASNATSGAGVWDIDGNPSAVIFENTNYSPPGSSNTLNLTPAAIGTNGIGQIDYLTAMVAPKNLSGTIAVGSAATHVDVVFPSAETVTSAGINSVTQGAGGSLTLLGSYHYQVAIVTRTGEVVGAAPATVTLTGSNRTATVNITSTSLTQPYRKRLYRGTGTTGAYQGYWDLPLGNETTFVDAGTTPFDGVKQPGLTSSTTLAAAEVDALYGVEVMMVWDSTYWITNRATTGFRINFHSAPGSDTSVTWELYR